MQAIEKVGSNHLATTCHRVRIVDVFSKNDLAPPGIFSLILA
jgi:hypothetical protein